MIECKIVSPLEKVFTDRAPDKAFVIKKDSVLRGETYSFQIAYTCNSGVKNALKIETSGSDALSPHIRFRRVGSVVAENHTVVTSQKDYADAGYERIYQGLYPDVLYCDIGNLYAIGSLWHSVWCDVVVPEDFKPGIHKLKFRLRFSESEFADVSLTLEVLPVALISQTLKHTEWFYCDCICHAHKVEPWTDEFWRIAENYFTDYSKHGFNMLLTSVFTPPLDTAPGTERLTTQLVHIKKKGSKYEFDFSDFERWVKLARKCGIVYFEISHLFTQWGAAATPKIVADVNGIEKRIFSWDVPASSNKYKTFLDAFLPELIKVLTKLGIDDKTYFHVSDEPEKKHVENYLFALTLLKKHLGKFKIMDAASLPEFYTDNIVPLPVPGESELDKFMKLDIPERWTYYCGGHVLPCSNRLHAMPASANRIIGVLLYLYDVEGFLHWGYNFWNSGLSRSYKNPLGLEPDHDYIPGDQCLVYPGADGPINSMRQEVLFHAMQDLRALRMLESLTSRKKVVALIEKMAARKIKMDSFPLEVSFIHKLRSAVNKAISRNS